MKRRLLEILVCPQCREPLALRDEKTEGAEIVSGTLVCPAGDSYPIVRAIPRFVPAENYASSFGFQWNHFRATQLDSHTGHPISRDRFGRETGWTAAELSGALVLDAGCGAGRFAEVALSLGADLVAIDYSSAIDAAADNLPHPNFHPVQADMFALPFRDGAFPFIYSLGVLQHTPDARRAVNSLVRHLQPGGRITVDFYLRRWTNLVHPKYVLRPFTTKVSAERLFGLLQRMVPTLMRISRTVAAIPLIGRYLRRMVPVADYTGILPLSDAQLHEWALLDTFDWLSPRYDRPENAKTLDEWLRGAALSDVSVFRADHLTGRGRRAAS
jgi:2-polyprenyl-3-methyl-5-hydroxy-6-metoxy-1,4-benzoquinol methylase/uncharacterized protein YbaR (Trm112 family)